VPLRIVTCRGGSGPGYFHVCRRPQSLGPALVIHPKVEHADLVLDLRGHPLGPVALARALDLAVVYPLSGWAGKAVMATSLLQVLHVPTAVVDAVTADLLSLASSVVLAPHAIRPHPAQKRAP